MRRFANASRRGIRWGPKKNAREILAHFHSHLIDLSREGRLGVINEMLMTPTLQMPARSATLIS
jgi:hypothetical protein